MEKLDTLKPQLMKEKKVMEYSTKRRLHIREIGHEYTLSCQKLKTANNKAKTQKALFSKAMHSTQSFWQNYLQF